jgi:glycosyltransferase involved in cell wall biosynthesis
VTDPGTGLRVLRIYHSGVVAKWRARERCLGALGVDVRLVAAERWNEGGSDVRLEPAPGESVHGVRTFGRHPNLFWYEPIGLWRALRAAPVDVLDVHEEPVSVAAAEVQLLAALARIRAPFVLYSAQNIPKRYPPPFRWMERVALRRAAAVHTCNDAAGAILRAKGLRGPAVNLGLGVDVERFHPAPRDPTDEDRARVGFVGRLEAHKGVDVLIAAIAQLPDAILDIFGAGPERAALEQLIDARGLRDRVSIRGFVGDELPEVYRGFDVVVVPSLTTPSWVEQFGRVAIEAMASGVAVIASDSGSLPEVLGDAGVLVPPGDVDALAKALEVLLHDDDERRRLGAAGRQRATHFSWPKVAGRQRDLYEEVLAGAH